MFTITNDDGAYHVRAILTGAAEFEELIAKLQATMKEKLSERPANTTTRISDDTVPASGNSIALERAGYANPASGAQEEAGRPAQDQGER